MSEKRLPIDPSVWEEFGIFPKAYRSREDAGKLKDQAQRVVQRLPHEDLLLLARVFKIDRKNDEDKEFLAAGILTTVDQTDILALYELNKRRGTAIHWAARETPTVSSKLLTSKEKPFTKLLMLYEKGLATLRNVFYYDCWLSTNSAAKFVIPVSVKKGITELKKNLPRLSEKLSKHSEFGGGVAGQHTLPNGTFVIGLVRKYRPRVARDYKSGYNLHHLCGSIILGISNVDGLLHVRVESEEIITEVQKFLREELVWEVKRRDTEIVGVKDFSKFNSLVLTGEQSNPDLLLQALSLRRTKPSGMPLTIPNPAHGRDITPVLQDLFRAEITDGLSMLDIDSLKFRFKGAHFSVNFKLMNNAKLLLGYENQGINEELQKEFEDAVEKQLGIPIGRSIDPMHLPKGYVAVIASLLRTQSMAEVDKFRQPVMQEMINEELVSTLQSQFAVCTNRQCSSTIASEEAIEFCQKCGSHVRLEKRQVIEFDPHEFVKLFAAHLAASGDWSSKLEAHTFEGMSYHSLSYLHSDSEDNSVVVVPKRILTEKNTKLLDRMGLPFVSIDTQLDSVACRFERAGSGVVSAPFLIASTLGHTNKKELEADTARLMKDVLTSYQQRMSRAASQSMERVRSGEIKDGKVYEVDIFNIARFALPGTIRLGREGKAEPDGILQLSFRSIESEDTAAPELFVIGYDTKLNVDGKGYSLPSSEQRKVKDYIQTYKRSEKKLGGAGRYIGAHAFISNSLDSKQMAKLARYLYGTSGLAKKLRSVRCLLIEEGFLLTIYQRIAQDNVEFQRRRLSFNAIWVKMITELKGDFVVFRKKEADYLLERTWDLQPVDERASREEIFKAFELLDFTGLGVLEDEAA